MWDRLVVLSCAVCYFALAAPFAGLCPEECSCETSQIQQQQLSVWASTEIIKCDSLNFLEKLKVKQVKAVENLDLSGADLHKLHKLKKLKNLKTLDLSNNYVYNFEELSYLPKLTSLNLSANHLKYFTANLPKLISLDLSNNYLTYIPHNLKKMHFLKDINLSNNPLNCDCDTFVERDLLLSVNVTFTGVVTCFQPAKLRGKNFLNVSCSKLDLLDRMQGDEPQVEGSGAEEVEEESLHENLNGNIENEGFLGLAKMKASDEAENEEVEEEGSGDEEGSGVEEEEIIPTFDRSDHESPPSCHFNCTELEIENKNSTEEDPNILHEIGIAIGIQKEKQVPITTPASVGKSANVESESKSDDSSTEDDIIGATQPEQIKESSWNTNLIIVIVLVVIMTILIMYSIVAKKKQRRPEPVREEEMKPLANLKSNTTANGNNPPEKAPLINGQNGAKVNRKSEPDHNRNDDDDEDLNKSNEENGLLPETHKVTIQAKEFSTPLTPRFVNRHRSEDGKIITTPTLEQS